MGGPPAFCAYVRLLEFDRREVLGPVVLLMIGQAVAGAVGAAAAWAAAALARRFGRWRALGAGAAGAALVSAAACELSGAPPGSGPFWAALTALFMAVGAAAGALCGSRRGEALAGRPALLLAPVLACLAGGLVVLARLRDELPYQGRSATGWMYELHSEDPGRRENAAAALRQMLDDPDPQTRLWAANSLAGGGEGDDRVADILIRAFEEERDPRLRAGWVYSLGSGCAGRRRVLPTLIRCLQDDDRDVRIYAARFIPWNSRGPEDLGKVRDLLGDARPQVRAAAAEALGNMQADPAATVPALAEALRDEDSGVRQRAAWALLRFGPEARRPAAGALRQALQDPDGRVREAAGKALDRVAPQGDN